MGVLMVAVAYRLPGVSWGLDFDAPTYVHAHPDEGIACLDAMERGFSELKNGDNPAERGMMFQCAVLGSVFGPQAGIIPRARISRTYSVLWGLLSIILTRLIARRLRGEVVGLFAAMLLCTSGVNLITSFWVRGQIQNVTFFLASLLVALRVRASKERAVVLLFVASAFAGAAIAARWSVALVPMLVGCSIARGSVRWQLGATATGTLFGFFASTGFFWTPDLIAMNFAFQAHNLVQLYSRIGPLVTGAAALLCILTGTGLVTFALALWSFVAWVGRFRKDLRLANFSWANVKSTLDSPAVIIGAPTVLTFAMLCFNKAFDARYTDLFAPPLAIVAATQMAKLWRRNITRRLVVITLLAYQGVYAASILSRYTNDSRKGMNAAIASVWKPQGTIYASPYVSDSRLYRGFGIVPGQGPWDAEWIVISDVYAGQYLTPSGTFTLAGAPSSCREILYCDGERERAFFQSVYAREGWDLVYVSRSAAWTPEIMLHHALMTSKWMFTGNIRLFHRRV